MKPYSELTREELFGSLTPPNLKNAAKPLQAYIFLSNFMLLYIGFLAFLWYNSDGGNCS